MAVDAQASQAAAEAAHRQELERLFAEFESASSPHEVLEFQLHLADAIRRSEPVAFRDKHSLERDHLRRLRLLGDGMAWRMLHPYAIRQLAKNDGGAQALSTQSGFEATLRLAEEEAKRGSPVLLCDLTNCLRVGDVIVCSDPERPVILESGGHPKFRHKGRKGRQAQRTEAIRNLLETGEGRLLGESLPIQTIEIAMSPDYSWAAIDDTVSSAMQAGDAMTMVSPGDAIYARRAGSEDLQLPERLTDVVNQFEQPVVAVVTMLQKPNLGVPPVTVWPISVAVRLALLSSDAFLVHFIDLDAFRGQALGGDLEAATLRGREVTGFDVRVAGVLQHLSPRYLDDVLLGFQTIESTRAEMIATAIATLSAGPNDLGAEARVASVESIEQARELLADPERLRSLGYVSMPLKLIEEMRALATNDEGTASDRPSQDV